MGALGFHSNFICFYSVLHSQHSGHKGLFAFLKQAKPISASGPLHLLFCLPGMFSFQIANMVPSLSVFRFLLKYHCINKTVAEPLVILMPLVFLAARIK